MHVLYTCLPQYLLTVLNRQFFKLTHHHGTHCSCSFNFCNQPKKFTMATGLLLPNLFKLQNDKPKPPKSKCFHPPKFTCSSVLTQSQSAKEHLLSLIADQGRGLKTQNNPQKRASIVEAIDVMAVLGAGSVTTGDSLSGTWRLLWTTEKEQLFIIEKAYLFGTEAGDVLQVIDVQKRTLNNVITFPPDGAFFVRSNIEIASPQRVNFRWFSIWICSFESF